MAIPRLSMALHQTHTPLWVTRYLHFLTRAGVPFRPYLVEQKTWRTKHQIPTLRNVLLQESQTIKQQHVSGNSMCWEPWGPYPRYLSRFKLKFQRYTIYMQRSGTVHAHILYSLYAYSYSTFRRGWNMFLMFDFWQSCCLPVVWLGLRSYTEILQF